MAKRAATKKTSVAKKEIATGEVDLAMFEGAERTGFEGTSVETFKTPFVKILQDLSPEVKERKAEYIEGAKPGQFINTATKELYKELNVIVIKIEHSIVAWKPNREGFAGIYSKAEEADIVDSKDGYKKFDTEGNELMDTISFYCVNAKDPADIFIIGLSSSSVKHGKAWSTKIRLLKSNGKPVNVAYAGVWALSTAMESNDKGDWFTVGNTPSLSRFITKEEYEGPVKIAIDLFKTTEADYAQMESKAVDEEEEVSY